jgi:hypothetical protein
MGAGAKMHRCAGTTLLAILVAGGTSVAHGRPNDRPTALALRLVGSDRTTVQLELTNVSQLPIDHEATLVVTLERDKDTPGLEHTEVIWTSVDPMTGLYKAIAPSIPNPRLELLAGKTRTITIDLARAKWSYRYLGNRTPEDLRDVAEPGAYELTATLTFFGWERERGVGTGVSRSVPARIRLRYAR